MAVVHVVGAGGGSVGVASNANERTPFVGLKIPDEINQMIIILNAGHIDKTVFRTVIEDIVLSLEDKCIDQNAFEKLMQTEAGTTEVTVVKLVSGLYQLLQLALRFSETSLKPEVLKEDLIQIKFPEIFLQDIIGVIYGPRRVSLQQNALKTRPQLPTLETFQWRVDVGISTSVLNRVLEPTVMVHMSLSDHTAKSFEVPVSKFHELRYNVAALLNEMENLEKRAILKIHD